MATTEQNFIKKIVQGDEKGLEYCMRRYGGFVKAVVRRNLGNLHQFEDECINDIFFAVWQHADSYRSDKNSFSNWIAGVARLKALDYRRRYARQLLETEWDEIQEDNVLNCDTYSHTPELAVLENEISDETRKLLECLKPTDRELFWKLYVDEEELSSVSESTGMPRAVIYNHLSRGKKKIRKWHENQK